MTHGGVEPRWATYVRPPRSLTSVPVHSEDDEDPGSHDEPWGDDESPLRGWVSPDDRLWRHPSERARQTPDDQGDEVLLTSSPSRVGLHDRQSRRKGRVRPALLGTAAACATLGCLMTGFAVVAANAPDQGVASTALDHGDGSPDGSSLSTESPVTSMTSALRPSMVGLIVTTPRGTRTGTGLVVEAGGIVATVASLLHGATRISAVDVMGTRWSAEVVGQDARSGVAAVRIGDDLPAASPNQIAPLPGAAAVVVSSSGSPGNRPAIDAVAATVLGSGSTGTSSTLGALATTDAASASPIIQPGSVLVDRSGRAVGILVTTSTTPLGHRSSYAPTNLVRAVVAQLVTAGSVRTGVLGATTATAVDAARHETGATLTQVVASGAGEQAGLAPGDVVVAVDGVQIRSAAELATAIYADPPGTTCSLTVQRDGATFTTVAILGD